MSKGRRRRIFLLKKREQWPFVRLFVPLQTSRGWIMPIHVDEARICFTQSTYSNANIFWKHPHRHNHKSCSTSYLGMP